MADPNTTAGLTIEEIARLADQAPWVVARGVARLLARGLLKAEGCTPAEAIAELQQTYGEAVNGR